MMTILKEKCLWLSKGEKKNRGLCSIHVASIFNVGHLRVNASRIGSGQYGIKAAK